MCPRRTFFSRTEHRDAGLRGRATSIRRTLSDVAEPHERPLSKQLDCFRDANDLVERQRAARFNFRSTDLGDPGAGMIDAECEPARWPTKA